jgi:uncharacterized SAM-binding protein YcdF (DUF218 family)
MRGIHLSFLLGCLGILAFLVSAFTPLPNLLERWSRIPSMVQPADAIVVLGSFVSEDGILSGDSLHRAVRGIALYHQGYAPLIVLSGYAGTRGSSEAEVRAELARTLGVPRVALLAEARAFTTREEAVRIGRTLRERGSRTILLVTDSLHMRRARALFERVGLAVLPAGADSRSVLEMFPEGRLKLMRAVLGEWLAIGYYRIAGYL